MTVQVASFEPIWGLEQVISLFQRRPDLINRVINRILREDDELRWTLVIDLYLNQQVNLSKAAELLKMEELELRQRFLQLGVPLRIGSVDLAEAKAEVDAMRQWFPQTTEKS